MKCCKHVLLVVERTVSILRAYDNKVHFAKLSEPTCGACQPTIGEDFA